MKVASTAPFRLSFATHTWLVGGMLLSTIPFVSRLPIWLTAIFSTVGIWRFFAAYYGWRPFFESSRKPIAAATLLVVAAMGFTSLLGFGLDQAAPLFIVMLWFKLLELHTARDVFVATFLSFFLVSAILLNYQTLFYTCYALVTVVVILAAIIHFHSEWSGAASTMRQSFKTAGTATLQALPLTAIMFVFIPRPESPWALREDIANSGFSGTLDPGALAQVTLDQKTAFSVSFPNGDMPKPNDWYWRGIVLQRTNGNLEWTRDPELRDRRMSTVAKPGVSQRPPIHQEIILEPHRQRLLFTLDLPSEPVAETNMTSGFCMERPQKVVNSYFYKVESRVDIQPSDYARTTRRRDGSREDPYLSRSGDVDPRVEDLARRFNAQAEGPGMDEEKRRRRVSELILNYFSTQGFAYTREPGEMGVNASGVFLFERKKGFCGHYAAAYATLARMAFVPARVIVGYRGGEYNTYGKFLQVRQSDAHAWCEVYFSDATGWTRVDPTTAVRIVNDAGLATQLADSNSEAQMGGEGQGFFRGAYRAFKQRWNYLEFRWNYWALGYDSEARNRLFHYLGIWQLSWVSIIAMVLAVIVLILLIYYRIMIRKRKASDPLVRLYERFCAILRARGVSRQPHEGPIAFSARAAATLPQAAAAIVSFGETYARARYGPPSRADVKELRRTFRKIKF